MPSYEENIEDALDLDAGGRCEDRHTDWNSWAPEWLCAFGSTAYEYMRELCRPACQFCVQQLVMGDFAMRDLQSSLSSMAAIRF